jgi:hypothetical protein
MLRMNLNPDGTLKIQLEPGVDLELCSEFTKICNKQFEPMAKWFDDPNVPKEEKEKYRANFIAALGEMNFLYQLLKHCGKSDEEIKELANFPF